MIQRIQSLFLLVIILANICMYIFPIALFNEYTFMLAGVTSNLPLSEIKVPSTLLLIVNNAIIIFIAAVALFLYKNRMTQVKIVRSGLLLNIVLLIVLFFFTDDLEKTLQIQPEYSIGAIIPILTIPLFYLTMHFINRDEKLVKAADRLR